MLKAREQMKEKTEEKDSILGAIKNFKDNQNVDKQEKKEPAKESSKDMKI